MPFKPGQSGNPSGKPKGRKNVKTLLSAAATLTLAGRNPVTELIKLADEANGRGSRDFKKEVWLAILPYCEAPQVKPMPRSSDTPEQSVEAAVAIAAKMVEASKPLEPATSHIHP